uniref:ZP domain-containing protein n=1 Tax=Cacopsylla melanoneura TaxID=428564 RepID=A0A8D9BX38_9HEMI
MKTIMSSLQSFGFVLIAVLCSLHIQLVWSQLDTEFVPAVTATCKAGYMTIRVNTTQPFGGAVHAKDFRSPSCLTYGNGSHMTSLGINLLAPQGSPEYCGVLINNKNDERSVPISVRIHRTLELADDKSYVITCGKAGFKNTRNETSIVSLKLLDQNGKRVQEVVYGRPYTLRAEISRPDELYGIRVKSCIAFNKKNSNVSLTDDKGCPVNPSNVLSHFKYDNKLGHADATLHSMFRFSEDSQLHFQCDIALCKGACADSVCSEPFNYQIAGFPQAQQLPPKDIYSETIPDEGVMMASTSVFVLQPGEQPTLGASCDEYGLTPAWLLYLCIAFGLMFLIMLIINVFLCSAMTCSCARTEVIEKEPSIIEDYDPYRSWHGSQYGSSVGRSTPQYLLKKDGNGNGNGSRSEK